LKFISLGQDFLYEISEPTGFNEANFVIRQRDNAFGRDVIFGNEETNELYYPWSCEKRDVEQVVHPNGKTSYFLDFGFHWIMETWRRFGYEGEIERVLEKDGVQFSVGLLDMANDPDTDGFTYFGCNVIQNTNVSIYKKNIDATVDVLATRNIKDQPITPAPTLKFLRKAVPITNQSQWGKSEGIPTTSLRIDNRAYVSFNRNIILNGINNTVDQQCDVFRDNNVGVGVMWSELTFQQWQGLIFGSKDSSDGKAMKLFIAKKLQTRITVNVKLKASVRAPGVSGVAKLFYFVMVADEGSFKSEFAAGHYTKIIEIPISVTSWIDVDIEQEILLPFEVPMDKTLYGAWTGMDGEDIFVIHQDSLVTITSSDVSFDTVVSGVRYIDMIKQCSKFINDTPVVAPDFDLGGDHYDNVCYGRSLLNQKTSNSLSLINDTTPAGTEIGEVVQNTNNTITGILPIGLYFWNGSNWIALGTDITDISLTDSSTPAGAFEGDLAYNTNEDVNPFGLCWWNGSNWISIQYNRPFITTAQDCFENAMTIETCSDYEIQQSRIIFRKYPNFYTNTEIASFEFDPDKGYKVYPNPKFTINNIKLGFDTFETNRLSKNTANDIHTEAEWYNPNTKVENKFERTVKYIRSGYSAQVMIDVNTQTPATAIDTDDKVFISKLVPLPPNSSITRSAKLHITIDDGKVKISNRQGDGETNDFVFAWDELGLTVGDQFKMLAGQNIGTYIIVSFTPAEIVLLPVAFTPAFEGDAFITFKYYLTGILWQTATDEGYSLIEGIENPTRYPNLDYSLRHIFDNWAQYFGSANIFHPDKKIKKLRFKNNPALKTQKIGGPLLKETEDIPNSSLPTPILGANCHDIEIPVSYGQMLDIMNTYLDECGFFRFFTLSGEVVLGYPQDTNYTWKSGRYAPKLEEKFQPDVVTVVMADGIIIVNDARYDLQGNLDWWDITDEYFQCFDKDCKPLCSTRHYSKVNINGVTYDSADELEDALRLL